MEKYTKSMTKLINALKKMPGVGPKSSERMAFHILRLPLEEAKSLAYSILKVKESIKFCKICGNLSEEDACAICDNPQRDKSIICVVEQPTDIISIEKSGSFNGVYHVLGGSLSPLDGVCPENLRIKELCARVKSSRPAEIIIATDSDSEGETTALYLARILKKEKFKVTRIAYGLPMGSNLEYADQLTMAKAMKGRQEF
ncbi:MAG: recombination mediator RecR [Candidatus Omnitrophota bacterium]|nr:recombination mediator RecR [Candidatus Omnitrophota bacterium]